MSLSLRSFAVISSLCVAAPVMAQQGQSLQAGTEQRSAFTPTSIDARLVSSPANIEQQPVRQQAESVRDTTKVVAGPTLSASRVGVSRADAKTTNAQKPRAASMGHGQNVALMVVGGAAFLTGLIIGGDGGTVIAIGGAGIGLWGLYNYIK